MISLVRGFPSVTATWAPPFLSIFATAQHLFSYQSYFIESAASTYNFVHGYASHFEEYRVVISSFRVRTINSG